MIPVVIRSQISRGERCSYDICIPSVENRIIMVARTKLRINRLTPLSLNCFFVDAQDNTKRYLYVYQYPRELCLSRSCYCRYYQLCSKSDVQTIVMGMAASYGNIIALAVRRTNAFMLPNAGIWFTNQWVVLVVVPNKPIYGDCSRTLAQNTE